MKLRRLLSVFLILLLSFTVAACSSNTNSEPAEKNSGKTTEKNESKNVEIRFAWWGNPERDKVYNQILDIYEKENPNVKIIREPSSWNDYWTKLSTQAAGGNLPDIFGLQLLLYGNEYFSKNVIEPLDSYVKDGTINTEGWDKAVIDAGKYKDNLYALAKGVTIESMIFNTSKLKDLGIDSPKSGITYEEFADYTKKIQEKLPKGEYAISGDPTSIEHGIEMWARQKGGSFLSEDGKSLGFTEADLKSYWTYWDDLRKAGVIPSGQVSAEQSTTPDQSNFFATGKAVFIERPFNQAKVFAKYLSGNELDIMRYPTMDNGKNKGGEQLQVPAIVMSKKSEVKEEAAKLINYFVNDLEATKIYKAENGIPGTQPVRDNLETVLDPLDVKAIKVMEEVQKDIPTTTIRPQGSVEVLSIYKRYAQNVAFGKMSIDKAAEGFFQEAKQALNK
ncbi:ABC transporter substrate-binding protein [Neobacillus niacini]|uniref:ABC transporter substrate-binding protein n=1 Tax=Neobacillus niacini TaxID=86668 RepID=UPI00203F62D5|nr:extracellular solute-binding protein [Neobacillus niacini]MCM3689725.1 extracellular solute-binding protein [Neobacillus niacini]